MNSNDTIHISIETKDTALVIRINENHDPLLIHIGRRFLNSKDYANIPSFDAFFVMFCRND